MAFFTCSTCWSVDDSIMKGCLLASISSAVLCFNLSDCASLCESCQDKKNEWEAPPYSSLRPFALSRLRFASSSWLATGTSTSFTTIFSTFVELVACTTRVFVALVHLSHLFPSSRLY